MGDCRTHCDQGAETISKALGIYNRSPEALKAAVQSELAKLAQHQLRKLDAAYLAGRFAPCAVISGVANKVCGSRSKGFEVSSSVALGSFVGQIGRMLEERLAIGKSVGLGFVRGVIRGGIR